MTVTLSADAPARLDKALARDVPEDATLSRSRLAKLIEDGAVRRGAEVLTPKSKAAPGDEITITLSPAAETELTPEDIPLEILFEDADLIVVNKPAGMVVHPAPGQWSGTLVNALMHHAGDSLSGIGGEKRPGIVHRIDKDTSGVLVVAKSDAAHQGLSAQFAAHTAKREYIAFVHGVPDASDPRLVGQPGVRFEPGNILYINAHIGRHRGDRQKMAVLPQGASGARHAITRARTDQRFGTPPSVAQVTCWLETGRTHQIRVHMAKMGHALIGDQTYGQGRKVSDKALGEAAATAIRAFPRQALHAASLGFIHPVTGAEHRFQSQLPEDLRALQSTLQAAPK